ncbi:hypothetical protein [Photorhabdus bodei]|uniref:Uncharacterized protein n=1 Tax=Photorhabdus bodei TaxID=2029681 RepID=A0AAW6BIL2_9GAMM|nr:hypothetical protein [Photorhabdus bodei]MDB6372550.1 hypothetical protein [Photorhabdus bodei]
MKLIDSLIEKEYRQQLLQSRKSLFAGDNPKLLSLLYEVRPETKSAFVLEWVPEQGEDLYTVLLDKELIVTVEISRINSEKLILEEISLEQYEKTLRYKKNKIQLAVALDIISNDIKSE